MFISVLNSHNLQKFYVRIHNNVPLANPLPLNKAHHFGVVPVLPNIFHLLFKHSFGCFWVAPVPASDSQLYYFQSWCIIEEHSSSASSGIVSTLGPASIVSALILETHMLGNNFYSFFLATWQFCQCRYRTLRYLSSFIYYVPVQSVLHSSEPVWSDSDSTCKHQIGALLCSTWSPQRTL